MMIKPQHWLRYSLLGIIGLSVVASQPDVTFAQTLDKRAQQYNQAQLLTQEGYKQLNLGQASNALETWKKATTIYRKLDDQEEITGSLIDESIALQALGANLRACHTLVEALKLDKNVGICATNAARSTESVTKLLYGAISKQKPIPVYLLGWRNLAEVLRQIGKLEDSKIVLKKALSLAKQTPSSNISGILLSLGNSEKAIYKQARNRYSQTEEPVFKKEIISIIQHQALNSLDIYQQVNTLSNAPAGVKLQAQLHHLNLLLDFHEWLTVESNSGKTQLADIRTKITHQIQPAVALILNNSSAFSQLPVSHSIYAKLNFAKSLNKIETKQLHSIAIEYAEKALQTARSLNNPRLKSDSFGTLGKLKPEQSQVYLEAALSQAQLSQSPDLAYQWQQQLGNLYKKQGKYDAALQAYSAAIDNLTQVRDTLLPSNTDLQFSFQEKVEPVYREYMRLLLASPNPNLKRVIQTNERLQIAQLENFLQCGKLDIIPLNEVKNLPSAPTVVHIIDLNNSVEVIVQSPNGSLHRHSVDSKLVKASVDNLLENLQSSRLGSINKNLIISPSQSLYNLLIAPIKTYLPPSGTLVLTLDTSFQSLPIGLLHDSKDYLLQHYSIAQTLGSRIRPPKFLPKEQLRALIAGLSEVSPSFYALNAPEGLKALLGVEEEVEDVKKQTTSSKVLLNDKFTSQALEQQLSSSDFSVVHLTTHAQFSSDPQRTMFFAWNKPISVLEFDSLLKLNAQANEGGIELLVLSACQTAKGNKKSALGIAGVAAQAGARSTVATLWKVDADSTALLMEDFYKNLKNGIPKAEALRKAQLNLMSNSKYSHPYFWSSFLLVGGWL
ncbi:CHAT domain-containing protein [Nostoc sp. MG11]|uniref:CHAT domain-containing protein n=1 Tax=Nostoc sp. MG11 TaxID=2721166 RepID=UPI001D02C708|nr:CHAT domain-containing protein [Nostoc sp. MG11]